MLINRAKDLPVIIRNVLPGEGQNMFLEVYNESFKKNDSESQAMTVAWNVVKKKFKKIDNKWIARSEDFVAPQFYTFELEATGKELIMNDENGEIVLDAVLASTMKNTDGRYFEIEDLEYLASQINEKGSTLPDEEHTILKEISGDYIAQLMDDDELYNKFKERKGIFKNIKAAVKDGKLWIRANLDKRYKNHAAKFSSLSIEAIGKNVNNRIVKPYYMGFTFTDTPKVRDARIVK